MAEVEEWFDEERHKLTAGNIYSVDIWGRFSDAYYPHFLAMAKAFAKECPEGGVSMSISVSWDNCGDRYHEDLSYSNGVIEQIKEFSGGDDKNEEYINYLVKELPQEKFREIFKITGDVLTDKLYRWLLDDLADWEGLHRLMYEEFIGWCEEDRYKLKTELTEKEFDEVIKNLYAMDFNDIGVSDEYKYRYELINGEFELTHEEEGKKVYSIWG
ncbi:MAG: hypothetical protein NC078_11255 [Ruminococcus sp.]|nr:hypothetical protein [Ruminococcus sp.]